MKKSPYGFTLVELLVVMAIIGLLAAILLPSLNTVRVKALRAEVQTTINQLSTALEAYKDHNGNYPPDSESNGGQQEGYTYKYRNDILVKYLDGDTSNGGPTIQYFNFKEQHLKGPNKLIFMDVFDEPFWYRNFHKDNLAGKDRSKHHSHPFHPWYNCYNFRSVQLYSKANTGMEYPDDPYAGNSATEDNFKWITNYK